MAMRMTGRLNGIGLALALALALSEAPARAGESETWVQTKLNALGYDAGAADGVLGARSIAALKEFQSDRGLPASGAIDQATIDAINVAERCETGAYKSYTDERLFNALFCDDLGHFRALVAEGLDPRTAVAGFPAALLYSAAIYGRPAFVAPLLEAGIDIDAPNRHGSTALMLAAVNGRADTARLLVEAGADRYLAPEGWDTAAGLAKRKGHDAVVEIVRLDFDDGFRRCVSDLASDRLAGVPIELEWLADTGELHMRYVAGASLFTATGMPRHVLAMVDQVRGADDASSSLVSACAVACESHCAPE